MLLAWQSLLADEQLASCPVLILGNKIDIPGAASEDYIRQYFGLYGLTTGKVECTWHEVYLLYHFVRKESTCLNEWPVNNAKGLSKIDKPTKRDWIYA